MIKMGFENVKSVEGGGKALEKYFESYHSSAYKTEIRNPITGKITIIKKGK